MDLSRRQEHDRQGRVSRDGRDRKRAASICLPTFGTRRGGRHDRVLDHRLERSGDARRPGAEVEMARAQRAPGKPTDKPNIVTGPVQVCWHKFARYFDVELREDSAGARSAGHDARRSHQARRREHDRRRADASASPSPASTSRSQRSRPRSTICSARTGLDIPDPRRRGVAADSSRRSCEPELVWDFRLAARAVDQHLGPQIRARAAGRGLGDLARSAAICPKD